jgi:peptidyl-prolyl cis-trans isomerase C
MKAKLTTLSALAALAILVGACDQRPADDSPVLAKVNGEPITEKEYDHYLQLRNARQQPVADKENEKKLVLQEMIDRTLMAQKASNEKMDKDPEIAMLLDRVRENILAQAFVRKTLGDNPVTDEQLKQRFAKELGDMHKTEYRVRHILLETEDQANAVIKQVQGGAQFAKLAKEKSIDRESGGQGGELGAWINQGMVVPEFFNALREMTKGSTSKMPVKSQFGWHVIKVDDTRALELPDQDQILTNPQARADLQRRIQDEVVSDALRDLKDKGAITIN